MAVKRNDIEMGVVPTANKTSAATTSRSLDTSPASSGQEQEKLIGSWLCADGPYREYIEALSASNPSLKEEDPNNKDVDNGKDPKKNNRPPKSRQAHVVLLDASAEGQPEFDTTEFQNLEQLQDHFAKTTKEHNRRRIYIMEGLSPDFVAAIGGHFFMEPTFFQRQERTCVWSTEFTPVSDALPQPSLLDPEKSFHLQYCELRQFDKALENRFHFCEDTRRHIGMTTSRQSSTIGIVRRKVSWWSRKPANVNTTDDKPPNGGWDVVILCDPELGLLWPPPKEVLPDSGSKPREIMDRKTIKNTPFQDGYVDFLPPMPHDKIMSKKPHPHHSMLRDLLHYYVQHSDMLSNGEWASPETSAIFLKKIVAAHSLQLVDYIKVMLPSLELSLGTAWVAEQKQWTSLQTISRRCGNYRDDIEDSLLSLGYSLDGQLNSASKVSKLGWKDCEKDFQYVYFRMKILKERADNLMQALSGLASIAATAQNTSEARSAKLLNLLAFFFVPLAYTSSLFGMENDYAPNESHFWVYWVSAIGVIVFTAAFTAMMTWVLDRCVTQEGKWTLTPLLKSWERAKDPKTIKKKLKHFSNSMSRQEKNRS